MAEPDHDELDERYRALGREEPPPELDARIIDAARRAAQPRPGRRRWMLPVSIAAVIVLSVGVVLQVQREQSEQADQPAAPAEAGGAAAPSASGNVMPAPAPERKLLEAPARPASQPESLSSRSAESSPDKWLAQIAELRRLGRDDEADRQLAEFRRRFPDYRIPEAMRQKVEPR